MRSGTFETCTVWTTVSPQRTRVSYGHSVLVLGGTVGYGRTIPTSRTMDLLQGHRSHIILYMHCHYLSATLP